MVREGFLEKAVLALPRRQGTMYGRVTGSLDTGTKMKHNRIS